MPPDVAPAAAPAPTQSQGKPTDPNQPNNSGGARSAPAKSAELTPITGKPAEGTESKPDPKKAWQEFGKSYGKTIKFKGEERSLADLEPDAAWDLMQKGHGASKLVEEAKATRTEAEKVLAVKKAIESGNDDEALEAILAIGGKRGVELLKKFEAKQQQRAELDKNLPPEVKALLEENERLQGESKKWQAEQAKLKQAEQAKLEEQEMTTTRVKVVEMAGGLLKALNLPAGKAEVMAPYVARALKEAADVGVDAFDPQYSGQVVARAQELAKAAVFDTFDGLTPDETYDAIGAERFRKLAKVHLARQGLKSQGAPVAPKQAKPEQSKAPKLGEPGYLRY